MIPRGKIERWCRRVAREFRPQRIIVFGSYAYGRPVEDSDVDVLVIMPLKTGEREVTRAAAIRDRVRSTFPMDVLVRTPQHVSRKLAQGDGFISQILQHGRLIYEAEHP